MTSEHKNEIVEQIKKIALASGRIYTLLRTFHSCDSVKDVLSRLAEIFETAKFVCIQVMDVVDDADEMSDEQLADIAGNVLDELIKLPVVLEVFDGVAFDKISLQIIRSIRGNQDD